jgi:hypothetical protein
VIVHECECFKKRRNRTKREGSKRAGPKERDSWECRSGKRDRGVRESGKTGLRQIAAPNGRRARGERARCGRPWARRTSPLEQTHPGSGSESSSRANAGVQSRNDARGYEQVPIVRGHDLSVEKRFARNRPTLQQRRPQESTRSRRWMFSASLPNHAQSASRSAVFQEHTSGQGEIDRGPKFVREGSVRAIFSWRVLPRRSWDWTASGSKAR